MSRLLRRRAGRLKRPLHHRFAATPCRFPSPRRFLREVGGGATAIVAAAVTAMTVGGAALLGDHLWLVDQRDTLKSAAEAASVAATLEVDRQLAGDSGISDADLKAALAPVARRYVLLNLDHLAPDRLQRAKQTLKVALELDRARRTVGVTASADLGGTLFSRSLPLLGSYKGPESTLAKAGVESTPSPVEVVLAIDVSWSMSRDIEGGTNAGNPTRMAIVKQAARQLVDVVAPDAGNRVAVGLVPWHHHVRLDATAAGAWARQGWARYPTRRRYGIPYVNCKNHYTRPEACTALPAAVEQALPAAAPETWQGCLSEDRLAGGGSTPSLPASGALLAKPAQTPFAQSFFPAPGWGIAYRCLDHKSADWPADFEYQRCFRLPSHGECYYPPNLPESLRSAWECSVGQLPLADPQYGCAASPTVLPLSTDPETVRSAIQSLDAVGTYTYSALGVLWGHRLLLSSWKSALGAAGAAHPVDKGEKDADTVRKAIVLLTDGDDTQCGYGNPGCDASPLGVARADACDLAKKAGIEVFVVAAMHTDRVSSGLADGLRACSSATDPEYPQGTRRPGATYVFLNNATEEKLKAAFADIASQLRTVRRTH